MNDILRNPLEDSASPAARWSRGLRRFEMLGQIVGLGAWIGHIGFRDQSPGLLWCLYLAVMVVLGLLGVSLAVRYRLSWSHRDFRLENRVLILASLGWLIGVGLTTAWFAWISTDDFKWEHWHRVTWIWSEICLLLRLGLTGAERVRDLHLLGWNPAAMIVLSFLLLITLGTILLSLPAARNPAASASAPPLNPFLISLYTSTSACCVTGLVVVDTGTYWSHTGQIILLCLIQAGGLGILTFGAFVALISGRERQVGEDALFRELLESRQVAQVQQMVLSILLFTFVSELVGAVLLWGVWPDLPWADRVFHCVFHSVAAFCNAGFALQPNNANFLGYGQMWQVWGVIAGLVIVGGLGFGVLYDTVTYVWVSLQNSFHRGFVRGPRRRPRLGVQAALILITSAGLLVAGTLGLAWLDNGGAIGKLSFGERWSAAWFQSVMARTAGFNSIDIGAMLPAAKLLLIVLMFIGASPVSTGGGIKTASFAVTVLALRSILRGRTYVEFWGRTIPDAIVKRASTIVGVGTVVVMTATLALCHFEQRGDRFLDYLFEATSAFATVGLSTGISADLSTGSLLTVIVTMFLGRVGPLTMIVAVAGREVAGRYQYPLESITLG